MNKFMTRFAGGLTTLAVGYLAKELVVGLYETRKDKKILEEAERTRLRSVTQLGFDSTELDRIEYDFLWDLTSEGPVGLGLARRYLEQKFD